MHRTLFVNILLILQIHMEKAIQVFLETVLNLSRADLG